MIAPRLVLLDLDLPTIDGHEVLRQLRADLRTKLLTVVVLTSSGEPEDIIASYALGANGYVHKPVGFAEFAESIGVLAAYWLLLNVPAGRANQ